MRACVPLDSSDGGMMGRRLGDGSGVMGGRLGDHGGLSTASAELGDHGGTGGRLGDGVG